MPDMSADRLREIMARCEWGRGSLASIRGRNQSTVKRWMQGKLDIDPQDTVWLMLAWDFVEAGPQLMRTPPSGMEIERYNSILYTLCWWPSAHAGDPPTNRAERPGFFGRVLRLPQQQLARRMSRGEIPIPSGLADGLEGLMYDMEPVLPPVA